MRLLGELEGPPFPADFASSAEGFDMMNEIFGLKLISAALQVNLRYKMMDLRA